MIFNKLYDSSKRGELLFVDGGMCHWHLRRDGQVTICEIISTRRGAGSLMLNRLKATKGASSLFAKCPADLEANAWYARRGFTLEGTGTTRKGGTLNLWRLPLSQDERRPNAGQVELIYCAAGNPRFAEIAIDAGWLYGAQLPNTVYYRPYFVDQDWRNPDFARYQDALAEQRPHIATVLDFERLEQLDEVLRWAEMAAQYVQQVVVIPKVPTETWRIPESIGGKPVRLGYSVPTKYAGTTVSLAEFGDRPVHLLGGSPNEQLRLARTLNVKSADGNYAQKLAVENCQYFIPAPLFQNAKARYFVSIQEADGGWNKLDAPYEAFRRSCNNIMQAWAAHKGRDLVAMDASQPALLTWAAYERSATNG